MITKKLREGEGEGLTERGRKDVACSSGEERRKEAVLKESRRKRRRTKEGVEEDRREKEGSMQF